MLKRFDITKKKVFMVHNFHILASKLKASHTYAYVPKRLVKLQLRFFTITYIAQYDLKNTQCGVSHSRPKKRAYTSGLIKL